MFMKANHKKTLTFLFTSVFSMMLAGSLAGQTAANNLAARPDILRATLTNGLQVVIVRNSLAPVVTTMVNYRAGSDECRRLRRAWRLERL